MGILKKAIERFVRTPGHRNEIDEIFEPYLLVLRFYGLQVIDPEWTWKKYGVHRVLSLILNIYIAAGTIHEIVNTNDRNIMIEGVFTLMVNIQMVFKVNLFLTQNGRMRMNYFTAKSYIFNLLKTTPNRHRLLSRLKLMTRIFSIQICSVAFVYVLSDLWYFAHGIRQPLSRSTYTFLPNSSPYFELGLLLQFFFLMESSWALIFTQLWYIFCCLVFLEASDVVVETLNVERNKHLDTYSEELDDALRSFYIIHVETMEYLNRLNGTFKWVCLLPLAALLVQISLFLMMLQEEINYQVAVVIVIVNTQIFLWNFFGELISSRGEKINMAFKNFDWVSMKLKDQKKYYIITCYLNKKVGVMTAIGGDLSLLTLSTIYKMIYQMFNVVNATVS